MVICFMISILKLLSATQTRVGLSHGYYISSITDLLYNECWLQISDPGQIDILPA